MHARTTTALMLALSLGALAAVGVASWLGILGANATSVQLDPGQPAAAPTRIAVESPDVGGAGASLDAPAMDAAGARVAVAPPREEAREAANWIEGVVRIPPGTPAGEVIDVIARDRGRHEDRAHVNADGSFRLALHGEAKGTWLELDAAHLYLDEPLRVAPPPGGAMVLEPSLGACITGRILPPPGARDAAIAARGKSVILSDAIDAAVPRTRRSAKLDADLRFELRGIPPRHKLRLRCELGRWIVQTPGEIELSAGRTLALELAARLGVRIEGRVVDDRGRPLAKVGITAHSEPFDSESAAPSRRQTATRADGTFVFEALEPGALTLLAAQRDHVMTRLALGALQDGEARVGLELQLDSGNAIAGRVLWPDGRPAWNASVSIEAAQLESARTTRVESDGSFRVCGLGAGPFLVAARARADSAAHALDRRAESDAALDAGARAEARPKPNGPVWHAQVDGVAAGTAGLELVLQRGLSIAGRVVDDTGAPLAHFSVHAVPGGDGDRPRPGAASALSTKFASEDGRFVLEGLHAGAWRLAARAVGFSPSDPKLVLLPDDGSFQEFVLPRAAAVRGRVLAPDGTPARRARVAFAAARKPELELTPQGERIAVTDAAGEFELADAPCGELRLIASSPTFADSEVLVLEASAGARIEGVVLRLRRDG